MWAAVGEAIWVSSTKVTGVTTVAGLGVSSGVAVGSFLETDVVAIVAVTGVVLCERSRTINFLGVPVTD